jgi:predicted ATPase
MTGAAATGPLLERGEELARIESAFETARAGHGTSVVVEGPPGIGKTALLAAAHTAAARSGLRVLRSRGAELERDFAFGVVRQLFEPALAEASAAQRDELLQSTAGVAAGLLGLPGGSAPDDTPASGIDPAFAILHGLYWLCANLAASDALCVIVDDAHWADVPSLRYLAFLLTRLDELPVALVAATRLRDPGTDAQLLAAVTAAPTAEVIRLPPLTRAAVAQLVESALADRPDPAFVAACVRATGGTPFLVRELIVALAAAGVAPTARAAGSVERIGSRTVGRSIELRLRRLPESARRLARALAVLERSDLLHAARLARLADAEAREAAESLANAGIVDSGLPLTFVHPIVRSAIYSELSGAKRAQAHRDAARVLAQLPGANERVARHLLASEPAADAWVVERLVTAAQVARPQARRSSRRSTCAAPLQSLRVPSDKRRCCSTSASPRRAPVSTAGTSTCNGRWMRRRTPWRRQFRPAPSRTR